MEIDPEGEGQSKGAKPVSNSCSICKEIHDLNSYEQFRKMEIKDRKKFAREKGLCYGCLIPGHTSKQCKKRKKCETCRKLHPTSLHGDFRENPGNGKDRSDDNANSPTVNCTKSCFMNDGTQVRMSSMIIPVWINHSDNPQTKILVYALLGRSIEHHLCHPRSPKEPKCQRPRNPTILVNDACRQRSDSQ
jgi:hypothetical protein